MTSRRLLIGIGVAFFAAACGSSPTAPNQTTSVTVSQTSATVARQTTLQLVAQAHIQSGVTTDVTQAATWTSSNPDVATVVAGLVSVKGLGPVQISVSYQGQTATSTITGRRRMFFDAKFVVQDSAGSASIDGLTVALDGKQIMAEGQSGRIDHASISVFGSGPPKAIDPGTHQVAVGLELEPGGHDLTFAGTTLIVTDSDTGELLASIPLAGQQGARSNQQTFAWSIDVAAFTQ